MIESYVYLNEQFPAIFRVFAFIFGAIVGSFLNVCIYRIPAEKSIVSPGSTCACGKPIAWYDNIPILSWLILRGKARCCGRPFSFRYPFIELLTGTLFLICWWMFPPAVALCGMIFCAILICATFIDFDHMIIPDRFAIGGAVVGVILAVFVPALHGFDSGIFLVDSLRSGMAAVIGLLIGSAVVLWIALLAEIVLRKEAMGFGDVKFIGAIGAFTGWQGALFAVFGGAVIGTVGLAIVMLVRPLFRVKKPEGPDEEKGFDLHLMSVVDSSEIPDERANLVIIAKCEDDDTIHFLGFDRILGKSETDLAEKSNEIAALKRKLTGLWGQALTPEQRTSIRDAVTSITGLTQEKDVALGRMVPFGPMLAVGGLVYFLFLGPWVDAYFAEAALLFQGFPE